MTSTTDHTLIILKPDALRRHLVGNILSFFETYNFQIEEMHLRHFTPEDTEVHYRDHVAKPFFPGLSAFMCSGPSIVIVMRRFDAVLGARNLIGATKVSEAGPATIRGMYGDKAAPTHENLVHASDSPESAASEIGYFFPTFWRSRRFQ